MVCLLIRSCYIYRQTFQAFGKVTSK